MTKEGQGAFEKWMDEVDGYSSRRGKYLDDVDDNLSRFWVHKAFLAGYSAGSHNQAMKYLAESSVEQMEIEDKGEK